MLLPSHIANGAKLSAYDLKHWRKNFRIHWWKDPKKWFSSFKLMNISWIPLLLKVEEILGLILGQEELQLELDEREYHDEEILTI